MAKKKVIISCLILIVLFGITVGMFFLLKGGTSYVVDGENFSAQVVGGETLLLELPSNPTTGYTWVIESEPEIFTCEKEEFVKAKAGDGLVGVGGTSKFYIKALQSGTGTMIFAHKQNWDGGSVDGTYELTLQISENKLHKSIEKFSFLQRQNEIENQEIESEQIEEVENKEVETTGADDPETRDDFTFTDLSKYSFEFCSGAGGWSTNFDIEEDGSLRGNFHDSELGSVGDDYPNGTLYLSSFTGKFKDLKKINPYCYEMTIDSLNYDEEIGKEEIVDETLYIYTDAYGLEGTDTFKVYLPGLPLSELSEEVISWIRWANDDSETLKIPIIVNEPMEYGIYSTQRISPLEDARMQYQAYQESYAYYEDQFAKSQTTLDMDTNSQEMYRVADELLNILWNIIKYNFDEESFEKLLTEQRQWIKEKEEKAGAASGEFEGGSLSAVSYGQVLTDETMQRCKELLAAIEEYYN